MNRFAVILTHNRPELLDQCVAAIGPQVDMVIVVDNASDPPVKLEDVTCDGIDAGHPDGDVHWRTTLITVPDQPPNLSKLWRTGIDAAIELGAAHIAVLCDDAIAPPGWFDAVAAAMIETGSVVGCSDPFGHLPPGQTRVKREPDSAIMERMPGWAWVLDPVSPVRPDGALHWWFGDTDIDWQARKAGGMVMVGGFPVPNLRPNDFTNSVPGLATRAGLDGEAFVIKHGWRPW